MRMIRITGKAKRVFRLIELLAEYFGKMTLGELYLIDTRDK